MPQQGRGKGPQSRDVLISKALSFILRHGAEKEGLKVDSQGYANVADVLAWRKLKSLKATFPEVLTAVSSSDKKRFALLHIPSAEAEEKPQTTEKSVSDIESVANTASDVQENATQTALAVGDTDPTHFLIRATQGHSMKNVDAASFMEPLSLSDAAKLPDTVVHGTFHGAWPAILESGGLRCMGRHHVHFATGPSLQSVLPQGMDESGKPAENATVRNDGQVISGIRRDAQVLIYIDMKKALAAGCPFWRSENGVILSEGMTATEVADGNDIKQKVVPLDCFDVVVERKQGMGKIWEHGKVLQELPAELLQRVNPKGKRGQGSNKGKPKTE